MHMGMDNQSLGLAQPEPGPPSKRVRREVRIHAPYSDAFLCQLTSRVSQVNFQGPGSLPTGSTLAQDVTYNFVGNEFLLSQSRCWIKLYNPTTRKFNTRVPESTGSEVQAAVAIAKEAQLAWSACPVIKRRAMMLDLRSVLRLNAERFKRILSIEVGKTLTDAESEFERGLDYIENACTVPHELIGTHQVGQAAETYTIREPLGVCVAITPFNFPFMTPMWFIPYAILAGNTAILKPSEKAPTAAQLLAQCFLQVGFPPGVLGVVHGGKNTVDALLSQPAIRAINFVGSDIVGERVYEHAKATRKRIQAECSSKNHGIVMEDANKTKTLFAVAGSAFGAAGQRCMALSVVVLVGSTKDWLGELVALAKSLIVGSPFDPNVTMGPVISEAAKLRIADIIASAEAEGATIVLDGRTCHVPDYPDGNFIGPTIITNVKPYMSCYQEEIFGPVIVCLEVETLDDAIDLINSNRYGNSCTLFTGSPHTAQVFQRSVNVGQVGINVPVMAPSSSVMRTGNKDSFLGDCSDGRGNWQFFTELKTITSIWH